MISDDQILSAIRSEAANTIGTGDNDSELGKQRAAAIKYYHGKMDDFPPLEGWSKVTTRDVFQTIESALPDLLEIFSSTEDVMEFLPEGKEDIEKARQETDVVNHVFYQQNQGFLVLYTFIKDALQTKNGFVKVNWESRETDEIEEYFDMSDIELVTLEADDSFEIINIETIEEKTGEFAPQIIVGEDGLPQQGAEVEIVLATHNITGRRSKDSSGAKVQCIPPEEIAISRNAKSLQTAALVRHTPKNVTRGDLLEMGISKDLVSSLKTLVSRQNQEEIARDTLSQDDAHHDTINAAMQKVDVADNYVRLDVDGNGKSELWHVLTGDKDTKILSKTRITRVPISTMTPIIEPHQIFGMSLADLVMDLQRIKTFLTRAALDNTASLNNQRPIISETGAADSTIDDVLMNRPASPIMVRGDARAALTYAPNNPIAGDMVGLVQYFDAVQAERTGIQRSGQSMDADSIRRDISATEFSGQRSDALKTIKLIARIFAETGLKDMMINIHHTLKSHSAGKKLSLRLNGKFVDVNPRSWINRTDMQINVGLGTGSKAEQIAQLGQILEQQKIAFATQGNRDGKLVTLAQIRYTLARIVTLQGFKDADAFFNDIDPNAPSEPEPAPSPDPALIKVQMEAQNHAEKNQIEREKNQMQVMLKQSDNDQDRQVKIFQIVQELQLKAKTLDQEFDFKQSVAMAELMLKNKRIELDTEERGINMGVNFAEKLEGISTNLTGGVRVGGDIAG